MSRQGKNYQKIGEAIKKARKESGMSQKDFGRALKVSDKTISSYEVGRIVPKFETIKRMSKIVLRPITYFDTDSRIDNDEDELQMKLEKIEMELQEIKKILQRRK